IVSDTALITAFWLDNTSIRIAALPGFSSVNPVSVDIIASEFANPPYTDQEKERIWVYPNLLPKSTFSTAQDTTTFRLENAPGRAVMATVGWASTAIDSQGNSADGIMTLTFPSVSAGIKGTPFSANRISYQAGQWYTARMRVTGNAGNTHQSLLFNFSN